MSRKESEEEQIQRVIDHYLSSNDSPIAQDLNRLFARLNDSQLSADSAEAGHRMIVDFIHQLDWNSFDDKSKELMAKNTDMFLDLFGKSVRRKVPKEVLKNRKIWFCLKHKNLTENYKDLEGIDNQLASLDSIQIVSLSAIFRVLIGQKFVAKSSEIVEQRTKWSVIQIHGSQSDQLSDKYFESKKDRYYIDGRKFMATIGQRRSKGLHPIEVFVLLNCLTQTELECIYNGSHLENVVLYKNKSNEYTLLSFEKNIRPIPRTINTSEFKQYLKQFPEEIQKLFDDRLGSSLYSFPLTLAYIYGDNLSLIGSFFRLKLGLLLSLLSVNDSVESKQKKNNLSVLVVCDDDLMVRRLFEWSSYMIENQFMHKSLSVPMTGVSRQTVHQNNKLDWADSGALQYGSDGITIIECVDNLNELPEKDRTALFHALVTNEVVARQTQSFEPMKSETELKTIVWASIEDDINEKQHKSGRGQTILWAEVFGMVYVIPQPPKGYIYFRTIGSDKPNPPTLSYEEWRKTIELMSQNNPQMDEKCERLITKYYMASRRIRGSKMNHMSVETLFSLSKSFAKLSLHRKVTEEDVVMAILLYEESLISRFPHPPSQILDQPLYHVPPEYVDQVIGHQCDRNMEDFKTKLLKFTDKEVKRRPDLVNSMEIEE